MNGIPKKWIQIDRPGIGPWVMAPRNRLIEIQADLKKDWMRLHDRVLEGNTAASNGNTIDRVRCTIYRNTGTASRKLGQ